METPEQTGDRVMTPAEAASMLGVHRKTLARWAAAGKLTIGFRTLGGHRRYLRSEVEDLANLWAGETG